MNEEARELQAAGADVIQLDEPWLRNDPEGARRYAVPAINRALAGLTVPTAVHLCFGYAAVVRHQKPTGYSFLPQLAECHAQQISIEAAQPRLDLGVLADLAGKTHHPGRDRPRRPGRREPRAGGRRASAPASPAYLPTASSRRPTAG